MHSCAFVCVCVCVCIRMRWCVCVYTHVFVCACVHTCLCVCMHVCVHGYVHSTISYIMCTHGAGKDDSLGVAEAGMTHAVVMRLVDPIRNRGHHVYMDNYYTSPTLFNDLRLDVFGACGTLRVNRRGVPASVQQKVKKGDQNVVSLDAHMLAIKWADKWEVTVLTTIHGDSDVPVERRSRHVPGGRETVLKPQAIVQYNKYMGGVDHADQLLSYYGFGHRTVRWWRRAFFFLLHMAVVNSYVLYTIENPDKKRRLSHEQFRITLAKDLLHLAGCELTVGQSLMDPRGILSNLWLVSRSVISPRPLGRTRQVTLHSVTALSVPTERDGEGKPQPSNARSVTLPCFELYHTQKEPQRYLPSV